MMLAIFWTDFFIISDCRNHSTTNLKTYEQANNVFNPTNTRPSSEESLREKCHTFISMWSIFAWFKMQILNICDG